MNQEAQDKFDDLVKLDPSSLTFEDRNFLRARRDYLTSEQKRVFADALKEETPIDEDGGTAQTPKETKEPENPDEVDENGVTKRELLNRAVELGAGEERDLNRLNKEQLRDLIAEKEKTPQTKEEAKV